MLRFSPLPVTTEVHGHGKGETGFYVILEGFKTDYTIKTVERTYSLFNEYETIQLFSILTTQE